MEIETLQAPAMDAKVIPMAMIRPSPDNARKTFDPVALAAFADQLKREGMMYPILVHAFENGDGAMYQLFDGERRYRAMKLNGATEIMAIIGSVESLADAHRKGLVANIHREDVNPIEQGAGFARQMELGGYKSVEEMAIELGLRDHYRKIMNQMSLNKLTDQAREALVEGEITESHAVLIAREKPEDQPKCLAACFECETVTIGLFPETSARLVSEKALRGWIQAHLREPAGDEKHAAAVAEKRVEAEAKTNDERALEREGERLAGGAHDAAETVEDHAESAENTGGEQQLPVAHERPQAVVVPVSNDPKEQAEFERKEAEAKAAKEAIADARDIVDCMCRFVRAHFKRDWKAGERVDVVVSKLLEELRDLREMKGITQVVIPAGVELHPINGKIEAGKKVKKPYTVAQVAKMSEAQIEQMVSAAAKYIVHAMEIDDTDLASMREQGMNDASIRNLMEAHFENELTRRELPGFPAEFEWTKDTLHLCYVDGDPGHFETRDCVAPIRAALKVPLPGATVKAKGKTPAKKQPKK